MRVGSLFSGGGGWEEGLCRIIPPGKCEPVFAVEFDPRVATAYAKNFGNHVRAGDIAKVPDSFFKQRPVDLLVSSPPCQAYSRSGKAARTRFGAGAGNAAVCKLNVGLHTIRAAALTEARYVLLEEVPDYARSAIFRRIKEGLSAIGMVHQDERILQASNHGSPTSRKRLIFRASYTPLPNWPDPQKAPSWWAVIKDLVPSLPIADLAPWQQVSLQHCPHPPLPLFIAGGNPNRCGDRYAMLNGKRYRIYAVAKGEHQIGWTIQLSKNSSGNRVIDRQGAVRQLTVEALGRLQGFTPAYRWPARSLAIHIIGNSIPPPMAAAIAIPFVWEFER